MTSIRDILDLWPNRAQLSRELGLSTPGHIGVMHTRGAVPPRYWRGLIRSAAERGIKLGDGSPITLDVIMDAHGYGVGQ